MLFILNLMQSNGELKKSVLRYIFASDGPAATGADGVKRGAGEHGDGVHVQRADGADAPRIHG